MTQKSPKRIILRYHERYELEPLAIEEQFFKTINIDPKGDYFRHLCPPDDSTKMHSVIDLYCKSFPLVNPDEIPHEVYRVKKKDDFTYEKLAFNAPNEARYRCEGLRWGTTDRA